MLTWVVLALLGLLTSNVAGFQLVQVVLATPSSSALFMSEGNAEVPVTPCTRICRYNSNVFDGQVCIGCFRDTFEIGSWQSMTPEEKYYALLDAVDRLEETTAIDQSSTGTSTNELLRQAEYWRKVAETG